MIHTDYLRSFFDALLAELYNDTLFREQMSDVLRVRAAVQMLAPLHRVGQTLCQLIIPTPSLSSLCPNFSSLI